MISAGSASPVCFPAALRAQLRDSEMHFIVTGATGWFGQICLEAITEAVGESGQQRLHAFASREGTIALRNGVTVPTRPLAALAELPTTPRYLLLHFAFLTKDKQDATTLDDYAQRNRAIRTTISDALNRLDVAGLCVTSSGAVYKTTHSLQRDLHAAPYAALKVEDEEYFVRLCREKNISLIIPRIFAMSGPYINKWNAYALASLIVMALSGEKPVINARHPVIRSYCYAGDIASVVMHWLLQAAPGESLLCDATGAQPVEIGELAQLICRIAGRDPADIVRDYRPELPTDRYVGNSETFTALAQNYGLALMPLEQQIALTLADIARRR